MREIKFKAYDEELEEWFYSDKPDDVHFFEFSDGTLMGFAIRPPRASNDPMEPPEPYCDKYEPFEFTGHKDCKRTEEFPEGQEIYDGDLLLTPHEPCSMVAWCSCGWMPFLRDQQTEPRFYLGRDVEVIGNIHENESAAQTP